MRGEEIKTFKHLRLSRIFIKMLISYILRIVLKYTKSLLDCLVALLKLTIKIFVVTLMYFSENSSENSCGSVRYLINLFSSFLLKTKQKQERAHHITIQSTENTSSDFSDSSQPSIIILSRLETMLYCIFLLGSLITKPRRQYYKQSAFHTALGRWNFYTRTIQRNIILPFHFNLYL